jgi:serine/threonine protein kinase
VSETESPVREGEIIAGKYRVERVLGVGGMGVVVAAMHLELEQRVALKFLLKEAASHADVSARFAREARSAAKIRSQHVARVIDVGTLDTGAPYMVMEYMDGEDLEQVLARTGPLPVDLATGYVLQATEAIAEAHALGIVHRDLKPANLFLAKQPNGDPVVKVLDFGISKSTQSAGQANLTKTSAIMGSPLYMSPEQMTASKTVDMRSDVWALGAVLYELLAQRTPFMAETMPELVGAILQNPHDPIRQLRPDVPEGLEVAIHRCLEKSAANRFANVAEFAAAIAPFGPERSDLSVSRISHVLGLDGPSKSVISTIRRAPSLPEVPKALTSTVTGSPLAQTVPGTATVPGKSRSVWLVAAPLMVFLLAGGGVLYFFELRPKSTPAPAVAAATSEPGPAPPSSAAASPASPAPAAPGTGAPAPVASADPAPAAPPPPPSPPPAVAVEPQAARPSMAPPSTLRSAGHGAPCKKSLESYRDSDGVKRFREACK